MQNQPLPDYPEKRKYLRLDTNIKLTFQIMNQDCTETLSGPFEGSTRNVGRGGICVHSKPLKILDGAEFAPDITKVKLTITLPGAYTVEGCAAVIWIQPSKDILKHGFYFGVCYKNFDEPQRDRLVKYALYSWRKRQIKIFLLTFAAATVSILSILAWYVARY